VNQHEAKALELLKGDRSRLRYSDVYVRPTSRQPALTVTFPLGEPARYYAAVEISLAGLTEMLAQQKVGSSGFAYLTDRNGRLVAGSPGLTAEPGTDLSQRPAVAYMRSQAPGALIQVVNFGQGKDEVVAAYSTLENVGWAVFSEQPTALAYKQVSSMQRRILLGAGAAILVAAVLAWFFSNNITRPLKGFTTTAMEIARGKFGVEVVVNKKNELGDLAQTFNYMSKQLEAFGQETTRLYESLENGYLETIVALANSIDSKDAYTRGHSQRVGDISVEIGREMGLNPREIRHLQYGGILHDIGKIGIVESILCKQSRLTDEEMTIMREHPAIGDAIIKPISFLQAMRACVRSHHERWDGTGYPDGLKGEEIPILARIVGCADTFDACTSTRPYQKAMPLEKAMDILDNLSGKQLDPAVVAALRRVLEKKGVRVEGHRLPVKLAS
jgi:HD-GYP domain-containing protein (c-di-GMP phosphodiesterase class II)